MKKPVRKPNTLTDEAKIITLICLLLENLGSLTEEELFETVTVGDTVAPFALSDALSTIEKKGLAEKSERYTITEIGRGWLNEFQSSLSITLKKSMLREGENVVRLGKLKKALRWGVRKEKSAYAFYVAFLNEMDGSVIMEVKIYSKTKESAEDIRDKFLKNPAKIIKNTITNFL